MEAAGDWMNGGAIRDVRGSVHGVSSPKPLSQPSTMNLRGVEAPRGHRASPIVPTFKTDKHLLIKADPSPFNSLKKPKRRAGNEEKSSKEECKGRDRIHQSPYKFYHWATGGAL